MFDFSAEAGLWGLFISAFVSATILPGNSEIVLVAVLAKHPQTFWAAIAVATIGNTLGGITSYWLGRLIPHKADTRPPHRKSTPLNPTPPLIPNPPLSFKKQHT